ncbi:hypothetical protein MTO96_016205 [Rhipicephalus appendiculatus]
MAEATSSENTPPESNDRVVTPSAMRPDSTSDDRWNNACDPDNEAATICGMYARHQPKTDALASNTLSRPARPLKQRPSASRTSMEEAAGVLGNDARVPEDASYVLHSLTACTPSYCEYTDVAGRDSSCASLPAFRRLYAGDAVSSTSHVDLEEVSSENNATIFFTLFVTTAKTESKMEMSVMRSGMMRSGISRIAVQQPPSTGAVCMRYLVLVIVIFFSMFLFGIAFYFIFLHKDKKKTEDTDVISPEQCNIIEFTPNNEEPPLICSLDGHEKVLRYPELLCSHIVFLSAVVVSASEAKPAEGCE